jgi:hypothetical protein
MGRNTQPRHQITRTDLHMEVHLGWVNNLQH